MPAGIVQVVNNTSKTLHYRNLESGYTIDLGPKTGQFENNDWIPSSNFHDDTIPFRSSNHIEVWLDDGPKVDIADDNYQFYMVSPVEGTSERAEEWFPGLENGGQYILHLDSDGKKLSFVKYEEKYTVGIGFVASSVLMSAAAVVGMALMAIFF